MASGSGRVFVTKDGSDTSGDGKTWQTSFLTVNRALYALGSDPGQVHIGLGIYRESVQLAHEGQTLHGVNRRFINGTVLEAPDSTSDILTVTAVDCGARDIQFMGRQGTAWDGTAILISHAGYNYFDRISFRQGAGSATSTSGGTAIHIIESERWRFTDIGIGEARRAIFLDSGATEGVFMNAHCSGNWEDFVIDDAQPQSNKPGGNQFYNYKSVWCKSGRPMYINGGGNTFIKADWEESPVIGNQIQIPGNGNHFIDSSGSPQSDWIISGEGNIFDNFTSLHRMIVTGNRTEFNKCTLYGDEIRLVGNDTTIRDLKLLAGAVNIYGTGTVIERPPASGISGPYRVPTYTTVSGPTPPANPGVPTPPSGSVPPPVTPPPPTSTASAALLPSKLLLPTR